MESASPRPPQAGPEAGGDLKEPEGTTNNRTAAGARAGPTSNAGKLYLVDLRLPAFPRCCQCTLAACSTGCLWQWQHPGNTCWLASAELTVQCMTCPMFVAVIAEAIAGDPPATQQNNSTHKRQSSDPGHSAVEKRHCARFCAADSQQQQAELPCQDHHQQQQQHNQSSSNQRAPVPQLQLLPSAHAAAEPPSSVPITPQLPPSRQGRDASTSTTAMQQGGLPAQHASPAPGHQHQSAADAQDLQDRRASTTNAAESAGATAAAMLGQLFAILGSVQGTAADAVPAVLRAAAEAAARKWLGAPQHGGVEEAAAAAQLVAALQAAAPRCDNVSQLIGTAALVVALGPQNPPASLQPWVLSLARNARFWPGAYAALRDMAVNARLVIADMLPAQTWTAVVQDLSAVDCWILAGCPVGSLQLAGCVWPAVYETPEGTQVRTHATGQVQRASIYVEHVVWLHAAPFRAPMCDVRKLLRQTQNAACTLQKPSPFHTHMCAST